MEQYEAFNRVYDATRDALLKWLIPRVRSGADVEDLMQEIYKRLYRKMSGFGVREPEKYVFGIAKKELAKFYRHKAVTNSSSVTTSSGKRIPCLRSRHATSAAVGTSSPRFRIASVPLKIFFGVPSSAIFPSSMTTTRPAAAASSMKCVM